MRGMKLFLIAAALVLTACDEAARPVAPVGEQESPTVAQTDHGLPQLARATAQALGVAAVRNNILAAMRASTAVEHRLLLADYLRSPGGAGLLAGSAAALEVDHHEFLARVEEVSGDAELAIAVPLREHRLHWRGTAHVGVAGAWDTDELDVIVYEPAGNRRRATTSTTLSEYDALFLIRPRESWGTRIDRQADVPGPVIQDPDDGEQAVVWTYDAGDGASPVSVDFGKYESEEALEEALGMAGGVLNDRNSETAGHPYSRWLTYSPIRLHGFELLHATEWPGSEEIEITVWYRNRHGIRPRATARYTGIRANGKKILEEPRDMLAVSPKRGGYPFYVKAVETDWGRDDDLGQASLTVDTRQGDISTSWRFSVDLTW